MKAEFRGAGTAKRRILIITISSLLAIGSLALIHSVVGAPSAPEQITNLNSCGVYPRVSLSSGTAALAGSTTLSLRATSDAGIATGPPFQADGLPTLHHDNGSVKLSVYSGSSSGSRTIAVTATNTGTKIENVTSLIVFGMVKTPGLEYSTVFFGRVIEIGTGEIGADNCQAPTPALSSAIILKPGESITGIMSGSWAFKGVQINGFQAALIYNPVDNSSLHYTLSPDIEWIA